MIRFALKCDKDHRFESWFQSGSAFEDLSNRHLVQCPECGSSVVTKSLMAPKVSVSEGEDRTPQPMASDPDPKLAEAIQNLRTHVEQNSDYVGQDFAREARSMHEGETPHRAIYGEVNKKEAKSLIEDGVPAVPLPFIPRQKTN